MPQEDFVWPYKGVLLRCAPHVTPDERFLAHVVVSYSTGDGQVEVMLTPARPSFETKREAADCGRQAGAAWVDKHLAA